MNWDWYKNNKSHKLISLKIYVNISLYIQIVFLCHSSMADFHEGEPADLPAQPFTRFLGAKMLLDQLLNKLLHPKLFISLCCQLVINLFVEHSLDSFFVAIRKDVENTSFQSENH